MASTEVDHIDTGWVREDPEAPSARFGWSGTAPRTYAIASFISGLIMYVAARDERWGEFIGKRVIRVVPMYWIATFALLDDLAAAGVQAEFTELIARPTVSFLREASQR